MKPGRPLVALLVLAVLALALVVRALVVPSADPDPGGEGARAGRDPLPAAAPDEGPTPAPGLVSQGGPAAAVGTVVGRIVRGADGPVTGLAVRLRRAGLAEPAAPTWTATDGTGSFRIGDAPADVDLDVTWGNAQDPEHGRVGVRVAAGRVTDVGTIVLGGPVALHGQVVDEHGAALPGARVGVWAADFRRYAERDAVLGSLAGLLRPEAALDEVTCDARGRFQLHLGAASDAVLRAGAPGFGQEVRPLRLGGGAPLPAFLVVRLVRRPALVGRVVDTAGLPVVGARVVALGDDGDGPGAGVPPAFVGVTDRAGRFEVATTWPLEGRGEGSLVVAHPEHPLAVFTMSLPLEGGEEPVLRLPVGIETEVHVRLDGSEVPVAGATVLVRTRTEGSGRDRLSCQPFARTDASGTARLRVPPGDLGFVAVARPDSGWACWTPGTPDGRAEVRVGEGGTRIEGPRHALDLHVRECGWLEGRVVDAAGRPVAGARVVLSGWDRLVGAPTDAEGRYRVPAPQRDELIGRVHLEAFAPGVVLRGGPRRLAEERLPTVGGAVEQADLVLDPAAVVCGRVVDATGRPVSGAWIRVARSFGRWSFVGPAEWWGHVVLTDLDGRFECEALSPGDRTWALAVDHPDHPSTTVPAISVARAGVQELPEIVLEAPRWFRTSVVDERGAPLPDVRLGLGGPRTLPRDSPYDAAPRCAVSDANGRAAWGPACPEPSLLLVLDTRYVADAWRPTSAAALPERIVARAARRIDVQVQGELLAAADVRVEATWDDAEGLAGPTTRAKPDPQGRAVVERAPRHAAVRIQVDHALHRRGIWTVEPDRPAPPFVLTPLPAGTRAQVLALLTERSRLDDERRQAPDSGTDASTDHHVSAETTARLTSQIALLDAEIERLREDG